MGLDGTPLFPLDNNLGLFLVKRGRGLGGIGGAGTRHISLSLPLVISPLNHYGHYAKARRLALGGFTSLLSMCIIVNNGLYHYVITFK